MENLTIRPEDNFECLPGGMFIVDDPLLRFLEMRELEESSWETEEWFDGEEEYLSQNPVTGECDD